MTLASNDFLQFHNQNSIKILALLCIQSHLINTKINISIEAYVLLRSNYDEASGAYASTPYIMNQNTIIWGLVSIW